MKVIIDYLDKPKNKRQVIVVDSTRQFEAAIDAIKKTALAKNIVRYIDSNTGETIKGDLYDTVEVDVNEDDILKHLEDGVKIQAPYEPTQYEPRNRFQENKNMNKTREKFQRIVKECLAELNQAKQVDPRKRLKESLRPMVEQVLGEIANIKVKEVDDEKAEKDKVRKGYNFDRQAIYHKDGGPERLDKTNVEKAEELETLVKDIDKDWQVYWDDHNELNVDAKNMGRVRITPKFENNFDIDFMWKLVDRIRAIALTWEQVKAFVKANLKELKASEGNKTKADKAWEKSLANTVDQDKNKKMAGPETDIIKNRLEDPEHTKLKDTPKKDKDFKEDQVKKDEDQPDQPMKDVGEPKELNKNIEKTPKVKPPKHDNDDTLKIKDKKTPKFRSRKS